jgi:c-di-GMP-related signal transduction protein
MQMEMFIARQPIFDVDSRVVAYELLFRQSGGAVTCVDDGDLSTARVINAAFYSPDGGDFLRGRPAYVNFPRGMLLNHAAATLPPRGTVIEVLETVESDQEVVAACSELRKRGYTLALDDVVPGDELHPLTHLAQIVKVDLRLSTPEQVQRGAALYRGKVKLLAEKVETLEERNRTAALGYSLFQGYFFAKPEVIRRSEVSAFKLNYLRVMQALQDPDLDFVALERQLRLEPSLSYKLLRFANSALYPLRAPIASIRQAMMIIGEQDLRQWLAVALMMGLASEHVPELMVNTLVRARFSELLASEAGLADPGQAFLLGLLSRIDALVGRPLEEVLTDLNVHQDIRDSLLLAAPAPGKLSLIWKIATGHDGADWDAVSASAAQLSLTGETIAASYTAALAWVDTVFAA